MLFSERTDPASAFAVCLNASGASALIRFSPAPSAKGHGSERSLRSPRTARRIDAAPRAENAASVGSRRPVAWLGALGPAGVGFHVGLGRLIDQRQNLVLDRLDRGDRRMPLAAVPLDQRDAVMAIVIGAAQVDRRGKAGETQLLVTRLGDVQRLKAAAHVRAVDYFLAGDLLRGVDRLGDQHGVEDGAVVEVLADLLL